MTPTLAELGEVSKSMIRGGAFRPLTRLNEATGKHEAAGITREVRRTVERSRRIRTGATSTPPQSGGRGAEARAKYEADRAAVKAQRKAQWEAGQKPQTSQQRDYEKLMQKQRHEATAARKEPFEARQTRRREAAYQKQRRGDYNRVQFSPWQKKWVGINTAVGVPAVATTYAVTHKEKPKEEALAKASDEAKQQAVAAGAGGVAGLAGANVAYSAGGFGAKKLLARRRRDFLIKNPDKRAHYEAEWSKHLKSHGLNRMADAKTSAQRTQIKWTTPKTLHDWKFERALAFKNKSPVEIGVKGAVALGAAEAARRAAKRRSNANTG